MGTNIKINFQKNEEIQLTGALTADETIKTDDDKFLGISICIAEKDTENGSEG